MKVGAHADKIVAGGDSEAAQVVVRPDAGEHKQLRSTHGAGGQYHLLFATRDRKLTVDVVLDTGATIAVERDPVHQGIRDHLEIGAVQCGSQVGLSSVQPLAVRDAQIPPSKGL